MSLHFNNPQIPSPQLRRVARRDAEAGPNGEALVRRAQKREERAKKRTAAREKLKQEGNQLFQEASYSEAAEKYEEALHLGGRKPVLLSNLAFAYLKLKLYEQAEEVATEALIYDPKNAKARYRRGLARKELRRANGASIDFEKLIEHDNHIPEAKAELKAMERMVMEGQNSPSDDEYTDGEYGFPRFEQPMDKYEAVSDSESSDCEHTGNSITCRFYNHEGCNRGTQCKFSHGPDDKSIRDDLGKNVCIFAVIGCCQFGSERCIYSHDTTFLPEKGWWNDSDMLKELRNDVHMGRSLKTYTEQYIVEMIHGHLYDAGYGPPRKLEAILDRSVLSHTTFHKPDESFESQGSPPKDQFIMFIALDHSDSFQQIYAGLLDAVRAARLETRIVSSASAALDLMYSAHLRGILIADAGITQHKHTRLANTIVEYTKNGGITVYGGMFATVAKWSEMAFHFERTWNVPWRPGQYTYETLKRNGRNETVLLNPSLPSSYPNKAFYIRGITPKDAMYTAQRITGEAPVIHVKCGKGYLGYSGENSATQSVQGVLAMFGLLDHAYNPPPLNPNKKPIPTPLKLSPTFSQHFVLLISLMCEPWFPDMYGPVCSALRRKVRIKQALTTHTALSYLKAPELVGIFITDFGIADTAHSGLLKQVVQYAKNGGLVVAAGQFSGHLCGPGDRHFFQAWGLPWKGGSYHRTTFQKNSANELVQLNPSLPQSYSMKALHMANIGQDNAVYVSTADSRLESRVWGPAPITSHEEAPAVQVKVGRGYFGYIGDVNTEEGTTSVLLAMLGLLDHKYDSRENPSDNSSPSTSRNSRSTRRSKWPKQTAMKTVWSTQSASSEAGQSSSGTRTGTRQKQTARKTTSFMQPVPAESDVPVVLVISLGNEDIYNSERQLLFDRLDEESHVILASTAAVALQNLSAPDLTGVLINEPSIANIASYADVLDRVIAFAKDGGTVVFGGSFSSLASARLHEEFWQTKMGIKWTCGSYRKGVVNIVRKHEMFSACSWLQSGFTMHAAHLKFADQNSALYCGNDNTNEAAVLRTRCGQGYVGYVGDIHGQQEGVEITLAMLDVITEPLPRQEFAIGYAVVG